MATTGWFARRTFHHERFADLGALVERKAEQDVTISACIPALNEQDTLGPIVRETREALVERHALLDEIVVVDSLSEDDTARIAEGEGALVVQDSEILPGLETAAGKGEAMWKSLFVMRGDLIVWLDADIENFHSRFVYGPLGPLLEDPEIAYVKAFYRRPVKRGEELVPGEGGRVTELMARPLLNMFWPELAGLMQPLSGEYAGRRSVLERIPFFTGYGVEIGMLIDAAHEVGVDAIAQVDLEQRVHRNRPLNELTSMSSAILQAALRRLASQGRIVLPEELATTLTQIEPTETGYEMATTEVRVHERPPANTIPEYASS